MVPGLHVTAAMPLQRVLGCPYSRCTGSAPSSARASTPSSGPRGKTPWVATLVLVTQLELVAIAFGSGLLVLAAVGYRALHGSAR
jgi:hypothetical protein